MDDAILIPTGHHILVEVEIPDEKTKSGRLFLPISMRDRKMNEGLITKIVAVGPQAWKAFSDGTPWAKVGDRVLCIKHAGVALETDSRLRIMNDEDVLMVLEPSPEVLNGG